VNYWRLNTLIDGGLWATLKPSGKAVFLSLERHCNREGTAYPSINTLCRETGLSVNGVRSGVRDVVAAGLFRVEDAGKGAPGRPQFRYFRLPIGTGSDSDPVNKEPGQTVHGTGSDSDPVNKEPGQTVHGTGSDSDPKTLSKHSRGAKETEKGASAPLSPSAPVKRKPPPKPKSKAEPNVKAFIDWYSDKHLQFTGVKLYVQRAKDGVAVERLLGQLDMEDLKHRALCWLKDPDGWPPGDRSLSRLPMVVNRQPRATKKKSRRAEKAPEARTNEGELAGVFK